MITLNVEDHISRDEQLEQTISLLRGQARGCRIFVTRVDYTTYTVTISPDTTFGLTQELDLL